MIFVAIFISNCNANVFSFCAAGCSQEASDAGESIEQQLPADLLNNQTGMMFSYCHH